MVGTGLQRHIGRGAARCSAIGPQGMHLGMGLTRLLVPPLTH